MTPTAGAASTGRRSFPTKRLADAAMVEEHNAALHGELVSCGRRRVAEYLAQWLAPVKASLEPAGYFNYRNCLTLHAVPRPGHVQLVALTPLTLSTLYAYLLRAGGRVDHRCRTLVDARSGGGTCRG